MKAAMKAMKRIPRAFKRSMLLLAAAPLLLLAQACNQYSYFDVDTQLASTFNVVDMARIQDCHLTASGADHGDILLSTCQGAAPTMRDLGYVRFSTFADSGDVTFKISIYDCTTEAPSCLLGSNMVTLPIKSGGTTLGQLTVPCTDTSCTP
jgi:hypothetical protein